MAGGTGGILKVFLKRGDNPGEVDIEMGDCQFVYNFTVQLNLLCVGGESKVSFSFITFGFLSLFS